MNKKLNLMLLSNSKNHGDTKWLGWAEVAMLEFLERTKVKKGSEILFIDFAGENISDLGSTPKKAFSKYTEMATEKFPDYTFISAGLEMLQMRQNAYSKPQQKAAWKELLSEVSGVFVAGGNTWSLFFHVHASLLMEPLTAALNKGLPYIGWSAGTNLMMPSISTTNDTPVVVLPVKSWKGLGLIPFQVNPHYVDGNPDNVGGETREMRMNEYQRANPETIIIGMREGSFISLEKGKYSFEGSLRFWGKDGAWNINQVTPDKDLNALLKGRMM